MYVSNYQVLAFVSVSVSNYVPGLRLGLGLGLGLILRLRLRLCGLDYNTAHLTELLMSFYTCSSSLNTKTGIKIAIKKLSRPFQSAIHAKRTYRELRLLQHMDHENVSDVKIVFTCSLLIGCQVCSEYTLYM